MLTYLTRLTTRLAKISRRTAVCCATRRALDSPCKLSQKNMKELFHISMRCHRPDFRCSPLSYPAGGAFATTRRESDAIVYSGKTSLSTRKRCATDGEGMDLKRMFTHILTGNNRAGWRIGLNFRTTILQSTRDLKRMSRTTEKNFVLRVRGSNRRMQSSGMKRV